MSRQESRTPVLGTLAVIVVGFFVLVISISSYLGPNDLRSCTNVDEANSFCKKADAIIAISGGDTAARTMSAIRLYQNGWADKIIFSGAAFDPDSPSNAEVMQERALAAGVPESAILLDRTSRSTDQNASNSRDIFQKNNIKNVILVTSAYHQRRAYLEFAKHNPDVTVRNNPVSNDNQWSSLWWLTPRGWWLAAGELVKIIAVYTGDSR